MLLPVVLHAWSPPPTDTPWPRVGALAFTLVLDEPLHPAHSTLGSGRSARQELLEAPVFTVAVGNRQEGVFLEISPVHTSGRLATARLDLTHLRAATPYVFVLAWDADARLVTCHLNGVLQGDLFHTKPLDWQTPPAAEFPGELRVAQADALGFRLTDLRFLAGPLADSAPSALPGTGLPLQGEARSIAAEHGLDLAGLTLRKNWAPDFSAPLDLVAEDDKRVREPAPGQWVLEGPGSARTERGALVIESADRDETRRHLVLWPHREFPADFLVEYVFQAEDPMRGLHILFFNTRSLDPAARSPFAPGLPRRDGDFSAYTKGALECYHLSSMSTDRWGKLRLTSNLRKNHGFVLAATGDDLIGGRPGPHRLRLLKVGGRIRFEVNGRLSLAWDDDGSQFGPVHAHPGHLGFRFMAHTGRARISDLRVYEITTP